MGDFHWTGAVSGDITTAGNYVEAAAPTTNGDNVYFDRAATNDPTTGTLTNTLGTVAFTAGFEGNLGNASTQPAFNGNVTLFDFAAKGNFYKVAGSATFATIKASMTQGQTVSLVSGTATNVYNTGSNFNAEAAGVVTNYKGMKQSKATIATSATAITDLTLVDGSSAVLSSRNMTAANVHRGSVLTTKGTATGTGASTASVATGIITGGSKLFKQNAGTDTTLHLIGAGTVLTVEGNPNSASTVTTANRWADAVIVKAAGGSTLTVTTENVIGADSTPGPQFPQ